MVTILNIKSLLIEILVLNAIVSAILVIIAKNPVISVVFLITLVLNSALYLIIKGMSFIGIAYILIYLGAIIVLFLFVIMMINIKLTDVLETGSQYTKNIPLALIVSSLFLYECLNIIPYYLTNSVIPVENSIFFMAFNLLKNLVIEINQFIFPSSFQNLSVEDVNFWLQNKSLYTIDFLNKEKSHLFNDFTYSLDPNTINSGPLLVSNNWPEMLVVNYTHIVSVAYALYTYGAFEFLICGIILLLAMIAPIYLSRRN